MHLDFSKAFVIVTHGNILVDLEKMRISTKCVR